MDESKITKQLTKEQLRVLRDKGTEAPFTGEHLSRQDGGTYTCMACGAELFSSDNKFESHCGWPSFNDVLDSKAVVLNEDNTLGMKRVEAVCGNCGGHLGHLFEDAPDQPTGLRYCINSVSLDFMPKDRT